MKQAAILIFALLACASCTNMYVHEFGVEPEVSGESIDQREVYVALRTVLTDRGMSQVPPPATDDHIAFQFSKGRSGILLSPFEEYLDLSYDATHGFLIHLVRIIDHRVDFSRQELDDFMRATERLIAEALPRAAQVRVVKKAAQEGTLPDPPHPTDSAGD